MIRIIQKISWLTVLFLLFHHCTNTLVSDSGGASETIAVFVEGSTITGKMTRCSAGSQIGISAAFVSIYENDYITFVDSPSINFKDSTITSKKGTFSFSGIKNGSYNLYAQSRETGHSVFIKSIDISTTNDTLIDTLAAPGSVSGIVTTVDSLNDTAAADFYDVYIPGSSFVTATDNGGIYALPAIPAGAYKILSMRARAYLDSSNSYSMNQAIKVVNNAQGKEVAIQSGAHQSNVDILLSGKKLTREDRYEMH